MSKRSRIVPAPFLRTIPTVIRMFGPRVVILAAGAAALLVFFGGGSYLLSHAHPTPKPSPEATPLPQSTDAAQADAQVLGDSTTTNTSANSSTTPSTPTISTKSKLQQTNSKELMKVTVNPGNAPVNGPNAPDSPQDAKVGVQTPAVKLNLSL